MKNLIYVLVNSILLTSCAVRLTDSQNLTLKKELEEMVKIDQIATSLPKGIYSTYTKEEWNRFRDSTHTNIAFKVERIFKECGFLGYNKVGKESSDNFWLLVQHSDKYPGFQRRVLRAMNKEVKKGNATASNYASYTTESKLKQEKNRSSVHKFLMIQPDDLFLQSDLWIL